MNIFLSLFIIFTCGILGGFIFEKIKLPKLVWYIILGILIGPSVLNIVDDTLVNISSYLRQIALVIILSIIGVAIKAMIANITITANNSINVKPFLFFILPLLFY